MKFNWNSPTLKILKNWPKCQNIVILEGEEGDDVDLRKILNLIPQKKLPMYYFTKPIQDIVEANFDKLKNLSPELTSRKTCHIVDTNFCIILDFKYPISTHYYILDGIVGVVLHGEFDESNRFSVDIPTTCEIPSQTIVRDALYTIIFELFLDFAEVETIELGALGRPSRCIVAGERMTSRNGLPIKVIDSKYFRNIIRTEGFKVRGHVRLQPYGPGLSKRKLIWINDFEKSGYATKAFKKEKTVSQ